jgi:hypothetical protein
VFSLSSIVHDRSNGVGLGEMISIPRGDRLRRILERSVSDEPERRGFSGGVSVDGGSRLRNRSRSIDIEPEAPGATIPPDDYEDGLTLQQLGPLGDSKEIVDFAGNNILTDSNPLNFSGAGSTLKFTAAPGIVFDLISLDVADLSDNPAGGGGAPGAGSRIEIIADGQAFVSTPTSSTFTTETLDLTGLTTLSINIVSVTLGDDDFAVDDVVLVRRQVAPVPAPALGVIGQLGLAPSQGGAGLAAALHAAWS